jgi:hypothetical protein
VRQRDQHQTVFSDRSTGFCRVYRGAADYSGTDDFELEISSPNDHKRRERVHVTVTKSSSGGEGI